MFSKSEAGSTIKLTWNAHAVTIGSAGDFCHWQLRIDGADSQGSTSTSYDGTARGNAVVYATASTAYDNVSATAYFNGLAVGSHTVSIWLRGNATTCELNFGNFGQDLIVEEIHTS